MDYFVLDEMLFHADHGCLDAEKRTGGEFSVSLTLGLDLSEPARTDRLDGALNYADVYAYVAREMRIHSDLMEHAAARIVRAVFDQFPQIQFVRIVFSKLHPPLPGQMKRASVILERHRNG